METMECRDCGYKGDDVQDFISTEVPGERRCPKCNSDNCHMLEDLPQREGVMLHRITERLQANGGLFAAIEYPGCIVVPHPTQAALAWWFGTANGPWQGDLMNDSCSQVFETVDLGIDGACDDPATVAAAIARAVQASTQSLSKG